MNTYTSLEFWALVASICSVSMAVLAIFLSITFYFKANKNSRDLEIASKNIQSTVDQVKILYEKLYKDAFGLLKDSYSDFKKIAMPTSKSEIEEKFKKDADDKIKQLKINTKDEINKVISKSGQTDKKIKEMAEQIKNLTDKSIDKSRNVEIEIEKELVRSQILDILRTSSTKSSSLREIIDNVNFLFGDQFISSESVLNFLEDLENRGKIRLIDRNGKNIKCNSELLKSSTLVKLI